MDCVAPCRDQNSKGNELETVVEVDNERDADEVVKEALIAQEDNCEIDAWIVKMVQNVQPDADISYGSIRVLSSLLDNLTQKVLEEAKRISIEHAETSEPCSNNSRSTPSPPLTSLDIHRAIKKILPGNPGDPFRPYLPAVTKHAWHLDKKSLRRIKRPKLKVIPSSMPSDSHNCSR